MRQPAKRKNTHVLLSLLLAGLAFGSLSCALVAIEDLEVHWAVDGSTSAAVCNDLSIDAFLVEAIGPETAAIEVPCGEAWNTGTAFYDLAQGTYTVTVTALSASGTDLGHLAETFDLGAAAESPEVLTLGMASQIDVFWHINGTVDGSDHGTSWDTCAEVGAAETVITVDGNETVHACSGGGTMSTTIGQLDLGNHAVAVKLRDGSGTDLTTEAPAVLDTSATTAEFVVDFFYDAFFEPVRSNIDGDYLFQAHFEGKTCAATAPAVANQVSLLKLDGTPVSGAQVCDDLVTSCALADGAATGVCRDDAQRIPDLTWGMYKLRLQGTVGPPSNPTICWETGDGSNSELEILVGAGTVNPLIEHDLARLSSEGDCRP